MEKKFIQIVCSFCAKIFSRSLRCYKRQNKKSGPNYKPFCSKLCQGNSYKRQVETKCFTCGKIIFKTLNVFLKHKKNNANSFCSISCHTITQNAIRKETGIAKGKKKEVCCIKCNIKELSGLNASNTKYICKKCRPTEHFRLKQRGIKRIVKPILKECLICKNQYLTKSSCKKYCPICYIGVKRNLGIKFGKAYGHIGSRCCKSNNRSKNEIYLAELCKKEFSNVATNEKYFPSKYGNWDADIILHDYKIAILWNGIWHYKLIIKGQPFEQTKIRDKIKVGVIRNNGYIPYIIKDLGSFNKKFVEERFKELVAFINGPFYNGCVGVLAPDGP